MLYHPVLCVVASIYLALHIHIICAVYLWATLHPLGVRRDYAQELLLGVIFLLAYHIAGTQRLWFCIKSTTWYNQMIDRATIIDRNGLIRALLFADKTALYIGYKKIFVDIGLMHMWVVSAAHMYSMRGALRWAIRYGSWQVRQRCIQCFLGFYVFFMCAGSIPLMRAWLDMIIGISCRYQRMLWVWYIMLCMYPLQSIHPSLVLSLWISGWLRFRQKTSRHMRHTIDISLDAWVGMLYPCMVYGIPITPWAWVWDRVWSRWIISLFLPALWCAWLCGACSVSFFILKCIDVWIHTVGYYTQILPYRFIGLDDWPYTIMSACIVGSVVYYRRRAWWVVIFWALWSVFPQVSEHYIHVFDVGRGSSILWVQGEYAVLLDVGDKKYAPKITDYLRKHSIRLDALLLSHDDQDHIGGVDAVISFLKNTQNIWMPQGSKPLYHPLIGHIYPVHHCMKGQVITVGDTSFKVLHPKDASETGNDRSCVWYMHAKESWLFPGDISKKIEQQLLKTDLPPVDGLVLAHHGSLASNHEAWFKALRPSKIVASSHIHMWYKRQRVRERFADIPHTWYGVTAVDGDIHITLR